MPPLKLPTAPTAPVIGDTPLKLLLYGDAGSGKTTFVAGNPKALILDWEGGCGFTHAMKIGVPNWQAMESEVMPQLMDPAYRKFCDTVAIDRLDVMVLAIEGFVCAQNRVAAVGEVPHGKGWAQGKALLRKCLYSLSNAGYNVVLVSHAKTETVQGRKTYTRTQPTLQPSVLEFIRGYVDFVFLSQRIRVDDPKDGGPPVRYRLATSGDEFLEAKQRCPLPESMPQDWNTLIAELKTAAATLTTPITEAK